MKEAHYPVAVIISIQKAARDFHTYGKTEKIRDSYLELITTNLWSIGILCGEQDGIFVKEFMNVKLIDALFESIETLGEEVYEENFDNLANMYCYAFGAVTFEYHEECFMEEDDEPYETFRKILPYFMSVLAHLQMHRPVEDMEHIFGGIDSIDYFNFDSEIEVMELFQTMEVLFQIGDEQAYDDFIQSPHCDMLIKTIMELLKKSSELVTVVDLKNDIDDLKVHHELLYPQIIQINNLIHQMLIASNPTIQHKFIENNIFDIFATMFFI